MPQIRSKNFRMSVGAAGLLTWSVGLRRSGFFRCKNKQNRVRTRSWNISDVDVETGFVREVRKVSWAKHIVNGYSTFELLDLGAFPAMVLYGKTAVRGEV